MVVLARPERPRVLDLGRDRRREARLGAVAAIVVGAAILVVQQLDGNVLQPVLVGRKLELHPVVVLLALTAGGVIAGLVGAFIAVPLAAVAGAVIDFARSR